MRKLGLHKAAEQVLPDTPPFPDRLDYLWDWFIHLDPGLPVNGWAPVTVTWESLAAWSAVMRVELEPWEAEVLVALGTFRAALQAERDGSNGNSHGH